MVNNVGYYEAGREASDRDAINEIRNAGFTGVAVEDPTAANLANLESLYLWNNSDAGWASESRSATSDIAYAVDRGMALIVFDRSANRLGDSPVPGLATGTFSQSEDIGFTADGLTAVGTGLGGTVTDSSLDNRMSTIHRYHAPGDLPAGATVLATVQGDPSKIVGFSYPYGDGVVIYFSMPMSASSTTTVWNTAWETFATNVLEAYAGLGTLCFCAGTSIETQFGPVAVQDLSIGDMVITKDHGAQPIRWIGSNKRPAVDNMAPILIKKGALGNRHDLHVSPQHRMLVRGKRVQEMCGKGAVLVPAKALVDGQDIIVDLSEPTVDYFHIAFDQHEIIYAEGIPSESLYLGGAEAWNMLHPAQRAELRTIFPDIDPENPSQAYGPTARLSLGKSKAERMLALH